MLLGAYYFSHISFLVLFIALLIIQFKIEYVVAAFSLRLVFQMIIFGSCLRKLKEGDLIPFIPVFDIWIAVVYPFIAISNRLIKTKTWK